MRFPHSHSLDDDPFVALHTINERSPSHHLIPLGSSFDEKMLPIPKTEKATSCEIAFSKRRKLGLQRLCQFLGKRTRRLWLVTLTLCRGRSAGVAVRPRTLVPIHSRRPSHRAGRLYRHPAFRLRRLCWIGTEQAIFQRRAIKSADDRIHLLHVGSFNECEPFGLLCFGVTDDLNGISDQVLSREPGLDVVGGHPGRKVAKENGITHSAVLTTPLRWDFRGKFLGEHSHANTRAGVRKHNT